MHEQHLECMWSVMDAVDTEAVVQGQAGGSWSEQRQLHAFAGGLWRAGLAHQAVRSQLLHDNVTTLLFQLQVAGRRQSLLSYCKHLLKNKKSSTMPLHSTRYPLFGSSQSLPHLPCPLVRLCLECEGPVRCRCV